MQATRSPAPARDNLLGVCHALGEAFGVDPLWLRVAMLLGMLVNFEVAAIAYLLAGLAVLTATLGDRAAVRLRRARA